jgi:hypothetical protein
MVRFSYNRELALAALRWPRKEFSVDRTLYSRLLQRVGSCGSNQRHIAGGGKQFAGSSVFSHRLLERSGQAANCLSIEPKKILDMIFVCQN